MRKFFIKFSLFLVPIILFCLFVEYKISKMPNNYVRKERFLEEKKNDIEVLVLGTSHALEGINPQYLSHPTFNLAYHLQSLYYNIRLTRKYIDKLPKLKLVIISIDHFTYDFQMHTSSTAEPVDFFYYHYYGILYKDIPFWDMRKYSFMAMHSLNWTATEVRNGFKPEAIDPVDENGYLKLDTAKRLQAISDTQGDGRAKFINRVYSPGQQEYIVNDLEQFIQFLQSRNIKVAFVTVPAFHTYTDHVDKKMEADSRNITDRLSGKYGLKYYNYFTDPRFSLDDYEDNDHLNFIGAERFSKILDTDVIRPLLH